MKKLIALLLAALMLCAMASCDNGNEENTGFRPFVVGGVTVTLDAEAEPIISALGTPVKSAETNSCYGDDKDKVYQYTSYKIQTYSNEGKDYILSVEIFDDADTSIATPEGICIGDSAEDVLNKHGTPNVQTEQQIVYFDYDNDAKLQILLRDGVVTNIQYLKYE